MDNQGFIKLYRKMLDWEWYKNQNVKDVFIHCILKANWKGGNFQGHEIPRGSFVSSIGAIADELDLTSQKVRTALKNLQKTKNLTIKTTNKFSIITINNYDEFQEINKQLTNNQQTTNKQPNNNRRREEIKNIRSVCVESNTLAPAPTLSELRSYCYENDMEDFDYENFYNYYESNGWLNKNGSAIKNWKAKLKYWYNDDKKNGRLKKIDTRRRLD